jgi:hypothetical protein
VQGMGIAAAKVGNGWFERKSSANSTPTNSVEGGNLLGGCVYAPTEDSFCVGRELSDTRVPDG